MAIEILSDWNERLTQCCGCGMPECPEPVIVAERKTATVSRAGYAPFEEPGIASSDELPILYETRSSITNTFLLDGVNSEYTAWSLRLGRPYIYYEELFTTTYTNDGVTTTESHFNEFNGSNSATFTPCFNETQTGVFGAYTGTVTTTSLGADLFNCAPTVWEALRNRVRITAGTTQTTSLSGCGDDSQDSNVYVNYTRIQRFVRSLSDPFTKTDLIDAAQASAALATWASSVTTGSETLATWKIKSNYFISGVWPTCEDVVTRSSQSVSATARPFRFRFKIPYEHPGSYFKITYDIAEFPETGDPSFVSQDNVIEWSGPGDPEDADDESWFTPWEEIEPPEDPGERRVVNIRFTCYHGALYGVKPQVMGEAFEPEE